METFPEGVVVVLDPVNSENNITARMTDRERLEVVNAAESAFETIVYAGRHRDPDQTLELWKDIYGRSFTIEPLEEAA